MSEKKAKAARKLTNEQKEQQLVRWYNANVLLYGEEEAEKRLADFYFKAMEMEKDKFRKAFDPEMPEEVYDELLANLKKKWGIK